MIILWEWWYDEIAVNTILLIGDFKSVEPQFGKLSYFWLGCQLVNPKLRARKKHYYNFLLVQQPQGIIIY